MAEDVSIPWIVGGDCNVILHETEKLGGLSVTHHETKDFAQCISSCNLSEIKFAGSLYTWWNGRIERESVFKRLDRVLGNQEFMHAFPSSEVHHLIRQGSNHVPLHVICKSDQEDVMVKSFRFLNFWINHKKFKDLIKQHWEVNIDGNLFYVFHQKMKNVKKVLSRWSKETYGYIFQKIATPEDIVKTTQNIGDKTINVFKEKFKEGCRIEDYSILDVIPGLITNEQNEDMTRAPTKEEVKTAEIIEEDIWRMVMAFFCGGEIPKYISHTNVLLQGFMKDRSITEIVLLAQEIIKDIKKRSVNHNVVVKLDMKKAYDRVSWIFLTKVMRSFGFDERIIDMGTFPFTYLGCPIFYGRKTKSHFEELVKKVAKKGTGMAEHAINIWWKGGVGFRSLQDVSNALFAKLWWVLRTSTNTLWSEYVWNKYCKKWHPIMAQGNGVSRVWRKMIKAREEVKHNIWWQIKLGDASFWYDNWTKQGALYHVEKDRSGEEDIEVKSFITIDQWDKNKLMQFISKEMTEYIVSSISPVISNGEQDKPWLICRSRGTFSVNST
ncbi:uncharacterized protein LOC107022284 [Solanum pennellii]|uniref:Uncharacterized protein LOC107022284 n=1 Tax=Solanum pennellii TaxID=28526 RepID=A0ABM1H009_SOLPN|nr:uncharacterized protein LOC107022284 [Solanum pennellii]